MQQTHKFADPAVVRLPIPRPGVEGARVLLVDDCTENLQLAGAVLLNEGAEVFAADSGKRALDMVVAVQPDLILLDLMMPGMDGIETCERLKMIEQVRDIPVIFLTAAGDADDNGFVVEGFSAGAVDFIRKPFAPAELLARVSTHVQLHRRTRQLERLAHIDALTGLPNRRAFEQRLGEDWQRCRRTGGMLGLLMLDIDHFKQYNDYYGHPQGDQALRAVAAALQTSARRVVDFCGRYGGEEFVVLTLSEDNTDIEHLAYSIGNAVRDLGISHAGVATDALLTVSIGYACVSPQGALNPEGLIKAADQALYRAKANGRDRIERALLHTES